MGITTVARTDKATDDFETFIQVPPQLIVQFGTIGKRAWFLDIERHEGDAALLLMTQPECPFCAQLAIIVRNAQKLAMARYKKILMVYVLEISPRNVKSQTLARNMNTLRAPQLFVCKTSTGRLVNWTETSDAAQITADILLRVLRLSE